ncbi:NAD(P)/FAD-dependent oxidoreductase [Natronorarus salvus]|uniref:NAD(P)/FAD-dependent oxidoreductase n=1 Tax=Natronorarus salvus TaxID=3117733 RepID=UPI002F26D184
METIVVGGGIVGSSVAYHLASAGVETTLIDRRDEGRATDAGAGIVSPPTSSREGAWFDFAVEAFDAYFDLVEAVEREQDGPTGVERCGILQVAVDEEETAAFDELRSVIERRERETGHPRSAALSRLSSEEAGERFPPLAEVRRALLYDDAARVDGRVFEGALRRAGVGHGLSVVEGSAERLLANEGRVGGVETAEGEYEADAVVIAGGAWSTGFADQLGFEVPVEPQRGQIVHVETGREDVGSWPIVSPFRGHYVVPWPDGRVAFGATRERGSGFDPRTTARGVHEVLSEGLRVAPGLGDASLSEVRVGLRPTTPDGLPLLGRVPTVEGVYLATGHGPTGLQLGPHSGALVADLVVEGGESLGRPAVDPTRFDSRYHQNGTLFGGTST